MRRFFHRAFHVIGNILIRIGNSIYMPPPKPKSEKEKVIDLWIKDKGDKVLRLDYNLNEDSVVFDMGGYDGQWASDLFSRYQCYIKIFEVYPEYAKNIKERFILNRKIEVFPFGLSGKTKKVAFSINEFSSSIFVKNENMTEVQLFKTSDFFAENNIEKIDLMKINIEGDEYDLLDHLIEERIIEKIVNIQIQFHDFVENASSRMETIQKKLAETHSLTYQYRFVWENWVLNKGKNGK